MGRRRMSFGEALRHELKNALISLVLFAIFIPLIVIYVWFFMKPMIENMLRKMHADSKARIERLQHSGKP